MVDPGLVLTKYYLPPLAQFSLWGITFDRHGAEIMIKLALS